MDSGETKDTSGYGKPPWIFKGSALYQLHLVKSKTARACIPKDFRLVEAFGYTLGGFFLASYDDSPAGVFDELVVIAGLVWNPPTSCAWATKVLVNSDEACEHGRKEVGLPSQVARFSKKITAIPTQKNSSRSTGFLNMIGIGTSLSDWCSRARMDVQVTQLKGPSVEDASSFNLTSIDQCSAGTEKGDMRNMKYPPLAAAETSSSIAAAACAVPAFSLDKWMGPAIKISLPSFSGRTEYKPYLLQYSCKIQCRVRAVEPAKVSGPAALSLLNSEMEQSSDAHNSNGCASSSLDPSTRESISTAVMLSKPIFALKFSCMTMQVEAPVVVSDCPKTSLRTC